MKKHRYREIIKIYTQLQTSASFLKKNPFFKNFNKTRSSDLRYLIIFFVLITSVIFFFKIQKAPSHTTANTYPVIEKKPITIIIPTFNDLDSIEKTLFSVLSQSYDNYRILIIDDHSLDETVYKARKCVEYFRAEKLTTIIENSESCGTLGCVYNAIHSCKDKEIAVILLGGDQLATPKALQEINQAYSNPKTWMTYGGALEFPSFKKITPEAKEISSKVFSSNTLRKKLLTCGFPLTFYATLFKEIPIEDLFFRGRFYTMNWEFAIGVPLLEMAASHSSIIHTPIYFADQNSDKRDYQLNPNFCKICEKNIRNRPFLQSISELSNQSNLTKEKADIVLFSDDNPHQLFSLLESIDRHVVGYDEIIVYYTSSTQPIESGYLEVQIAYPKPTYVRYTDSLKTELINRVFSPAFSTSPYVVFAQDGVIVTDLIDLGNSIQSLESSKAYGLYFDLHNDLCYSSELSRFQPLPPSTRLFGISPTTHLRAWQLSKGRDDWNNRGSLHFALFRKADLATQIIESPFSTPQQFLYFWNLGLQNEIGLFYDYPKTISLKKSPQSQTDLEKFLSGFKLDLTPLLQLQPSCREGAINSAFVPR